MREKKLSDLKPEELTVFLMIQDLMNDYFTGSVTLHLSEGEVRKAETTEDGWECNTMLHF